MTNPLDSLTQQYADRVQAILNILMESPYFYRSDHEDLFLFLRRYQEEFRQFYERYYGWNLIMDMKCARVFKDRWYNQAITPANRMQFNLTRRDECLAFMLLLRFFEHLLDEQSLTVESAIAPRFHFGDLLEYCRQGFLELGYDAEKYTLEFVRADILRQMMPTLERFRFLRKLDPEGLKIKADDVIYETLPALYHYNAGILSRPLEDQSAESAAPEEPDAAEPAAALGEDDAC
jgi:hypothetical protein